MIDSLRSGPRTRAGDPIPVLFEDDDLLAVDKPEGVASIPENVDKKNDVLTLLSEYAGRRLYVIHRIDKGVTGVLLYGKTEAAYRAIGAQFAERTVDKRYDALVIGRVAEETGRIDAPLRKFGSGRVGVDEAAGKPAATEYSVRERFVDHTWVDVHPITGRRHQIRAHFLLAGHPVAGDRRYGDQRRQGSFPRLMLHARSLAFQHAGERRTLLCPPPSSFLDVIAALPATAPAGR